MVKTSFNYLPIEWTIIRRGGSLMIVVGKPIYEKYKMKEGDKIIVQILKVISKDGSSR